MDISDARDALLMSGIFNSFFTSSSVVVLQKKLFLYFFKIGFDARIDTALEIVFSF